MHKGELMQSSLVGPFEIGYHTVAAQGICGTLLVPMVPDSVSGGYRASSRISNETSPRLCALRRWPGAKGGYATKNDRVLDVSPNNDVLREENPR
jgi:hypothetical protein